MATGALDALGSQVEDVWVITREGYNDVTLSLDKRVRQLESGHPVPDRRSVEVGARLLAFLATKDSPILFLISGGSSALVESLPENVSLTDIQRVNDWLLASGLPIHSMNSVRTALSRIKGGGLAAHVRNKKSQVLLISDVVGNDPAIIGSGLLCQNPLAHQETLSGLLDEVPQWLVEMLKRTRLERAAVDNNDAELLHTVIANADTARRAACEKARSLGYSVIEHEQFIDGDVLRAAQQIAANLKTTDRGVHIWSGEPTVYLPENPGRGGRCQSMALAVSLAFLRGMPVYQGWYFLAAGTDGCDGNGDAAGAIVDAGSLGRMMEAGADPVACLTHANAGHCLGLSGDLLYTGHTGTNVMDIFIGLSLA